MIPEAQMTPRELLVKSRELLSDPARWTKQAYARDERGRPCEVSSPNAKSFCLLGAMLRECDRPRLVFDADWFLFAHAGATALILNDDAQTSHADLMTALDGVIQKCG